MSTKDTLDFLDDVFENQYKKRDTLKRVCGVVQEIIEGTSYGKAKIKIGNSSPILLNKTGEILNVGDHVWVHYWHSLMDGYIALRVGVSNPYGGFHIDNAAVLTEQQSSVYDVAREVINVDVENKMKSHYGSYKNTIIVDGFPAISCGNVSNTVIYPFVSQADLELQAKVLTLSSSMLSSRVASYWVPQDNSSFVFGNEYHYYMEIDKMSNIDGEWCYTLGMFCEEVRSWSISSSVYFKDKDLLSNAGIIFVYNAISGGGYDHGWAQGFPILCCGGANSGYYYNAATGQVERTGGLLVGTKGFYHMPFKSDAEMHYALSLAERSEIISTR